MDFETQRKKRMQDLEEKRRRLDEMRKLRKDRTDAAEDVPAVENSQKAVSVAASSTTTASSADERAQVDDLVSSLLVSSLHESIPSTNTTTSSSSGVNSSSNHSLDDAPGLVAVWSLGLPTRPEYLFTSLSPVVTARFHSEEPHLILGGCYSGQILLWDMRAKSFLPIQRSSLATGKGHKHPICGMTMVRSGPTLELITASSDG